MSDELKSLLAQLTRPSRSAFDAEVRSALAAIIRRGQVRSAWDEHNNKPVKVWLIGKRDDDFENHLANITDDTAAAVLHLFGEGTACFYIENGEMQWRLRHDV